MPRSRLHELDALRGLAALIVLLHHNMVAAGLFVEPLRSLLIASPLRVIWSGRPAVMFFFVLSGFVLTRALSRTALTPATLATWAIQRSIRLLVPCAAAVLVSAALYTVMHAGPWPGQPTFLRDALWTVPLSWGDAARQSLLLAPDGGYTLDHVLWSLAVEWRVSLFLPLIAVPAMFAGRQGALCLLLVGIGVACFVGSDAGQELNAGTSMLNATRGTVYFTLPFVIGVALERSGLCAVSVRPALLACAAIAIVGLMRMNADLAVFLASALLIWLAQQPSLFRRALLHPALVWCGTVSFSLYLIHTPMLLALHHGLHGAVPAWGVFALSLSAALPAAWGFHIGAERPAQWLARAWVSHERLVQVRAAAPSMPH